MTDSKPNCIYCMPERERSPQGGADKRVQSQWQAEAEELSDDQIG